MRAPRSGFLTVNQGLLRRLPTGRHRPTMDAFWPVSRFFDKAK